MILSGYLIFDYYLDRLKAESAYDELSGFAMSEKAEATEPISNSTEATEHPETDSLVSVDFEKLTAEYPDTVGWLYCEGTPINYPVVQSKDNLRYLRRLPDGSYNAAGSLFADYRCKEVAASGNYIIYGHNMKNRTMFRSLKKFIQEEGMADGNPWFYLYTEDKAVRYRIISYYTTVSGSDTYQSVYTDEDYDSYLDMILRKSLFKGYQEASTQGRPDMVTLSTCHGKAGGTGRFVVHGVVDEVRQMK